MKKCQKKIKVYKNLTVVFLLLFYSCFLVNYGTSETTAIIAFSSLLLSGFFIAKASNETFRLKKIQSRRAKCFSKMLYLSEL